MFIEEKPSLTSRFAFAVLSTLGGQGFSLLGPAQPLKPLSNRIRVGKEMALSWLAPISLAKEIEKVSKKRMSQTSRRKRTISRAIASPCGLEM